MFALNPQQDPSVNLLAILVGAGILQLWAWPGQWWGLQIAFYYNKRNENMHANGVHLCHHSTCNIHNLGLFPTTASSNWGTLRCGRKCLNWTWSWTRNWVPSKQKTIIQVMSQSVGTLIFCLIPISHFYLQLLIDCLYSMQKQEKTFRNFIKCDVVRWGVLPSQ